MTNMVTLMFGCHSFQSMDMVTHPHCPETATIPPFTPVECYYTHSC